MSRCTICDDPTATLVVRLTLANGASRELPYCNDCFHRYLLRHAAAPLVVRVTEDA